MVILSNIVRIVMFKFPSRSPGAKYSSGQGSRHDAQKYNYYKRTKNSGVGSVSSSYGCENYPPPACQA